MIIITKCVSRINNEYFVLLKRTGVASGFYSDTRGTRVWMVSGPYLSSTKYSRKVFIKLGHYYTQVVVNVTTFKLLGVACSNKETKISEIARIFSDKTCVQFGMGAALFIML